MGGGVQNQLFMYLFIVGGGGDWEKVHREANDLGVDPNPGLCISLALDVGMWVSARIWEPKKILQSTRT